MQLLLVRIAGVVLLCAVSALAANDLRLIQAVKRRDRQAISALLATRLDINAAQPDGATALAWAAYLGESDVAEKLLAAGAKPNTADDYGETPLTLAGANGDARLVGELLVAGADPNAARWDGETALMIAAGAGSAQAVDLLVGRGAKVDAAEPRHGQTALMWAAAEGHPEVVKSLVARGADVRAVSKRGFTALTFAAVKNDAASAEALLAAGANPDYVLPGGPSVLTVAASYQSVAVATLLLDHGANPNFSSQKGETPLHIAARTGEITLVEKLLAKGANVNARTAAEPVSATYSELFQRFRFTAGELTPLMLAAQHDHVEVMRALVAAGADGRLKAQDGTTVLTAATSSGYLDAVQYAYELDPDVNVTSTVTGFTVMHTVVRSMSEKLTEDQICDVIRFLAAHGAALDAADIRGRTPVYYANLPPIEKAVKLLLGLIAQSGAQPKIVPKR